MNRLPTSQTTTVAMARIRDAIRPVGLDDQPDADLLDRYARYADHPAFEALLRRHGPMVFGVCRRVLTNPADAEDAFQAAFLVLVRKAGSVRHGDRLGPWLYGVALRVACKARVRAARTAARHSEATDMIPDPNAHAQAPDWLPVLDAELNALPAKYREPLVLCELQGATRADAAKALRIPEGTLSSRLARGRELLRRRLLKHGTLLPAGGLAALFSAGGVGRAAVPAGLLARTSELAAVIATGAALAGAVPAGPARLTDEVLKGMFLTNLRTAGAAVLSLGLLAAALLAAAPEDAPGRSATGAVPLPQSKADRPAEPLRGVPSVNLGTAPVADRDALQGLWVLDKYTAGKGQKGEPQEQLAGAVGRMHFLVAGDAWWCFMTGPSNGVFPQMAKIDPAKNPKWLDLTNLENGPGDLTRCIYELDGDKLRVCMIEADQKTRPAEFAAGEGVDVMQFRREKLPPDAGEAALVGSWAGPGLRPAGKPDGLTVSDPAPRVEVLGGFLFAYLPDGPRGGKWVGGKYTVDRSKIPKWIEVDLVCQYGGVSKLYGCYEVEEGRLRLALGTKRATRPLEFTPAPGVIFLAAEPTKEPLAAPAREEVPAPRPKPPSPDEEVRALMKEEKYAAAERRLRELLPGSSRPLLAERLVRRGACLAALAQKADAAGAKKLRDEAVEVYLSAVAVAETLPPDSKHAAWVRTEAELRTLAVLQQQGKAAEVLSAAVPLLDRHRGTVDELIILSLVYHAFKQKGESGRALQTRDQMKEAFDRLPASAFTAEKGEYSREYWEKTWFASEK